MEKLEKDLWLACKFAKKMQDNGVRPAIANYKAGNYYGYTASEVGTARAYLKEMYKENKSRKRL